MASEPTNSNSQDGLRKFSIVKWEDNLNVNKLDEANLVLCEAFGWKFFSSCLDESRDLVYKVLMSYLKMGVAGGEVYFALNDREEVIGVAIWFGPGQKPFATPELRALGWDELMEKLSPKCRDWWPNFLRTYDQFLDDALGKEVRLNSYHLQLIGIHPDHQKKGIATAMMELVEAKSRNAGVLSVLEATSEAMKDVYSKMGYVMRGTSEPMKTADGAADKVFRVLTKE